MKKLLKDYMKAIAGTTIQGDAREESYYDSLKALFSDFPLDEERNTKVTVLPKQTEAGNPDFRVWDGEHFIVGYIEAKTPGTNLDQVETSEQLERYLNTFPNLILTDFYEFRLYRDGAEINRVRIGRHFTARTLKATPQLENIDDFVALADQFFSFKLPKTFSAETLAVELAKRTRFLRDQVVAEELRDESLGGGGLSGFYKAFKKYLIAGLTPEQFADLYSQTITYGLFAARTRADGNFNRKLAFDFIPPTIGILRDVFKFISLGELSPQMAVIVDDITAVLNAADINNILDQYYMQGKGEDPIVHFYETFLNKYDPETRERRGVYYTPEPVVKYIVRSVHKLLKDKFGLRDGLADPAVTVLDPAAGTLTFPAEAIRLAVGEYVGKYGEGGKKGFIRDQVLKNFYAFELMMAPYAIGHMKISILLESLGYAMSAEDRFQLYLTNTLEMEEIDQIGIPGLHSLSEESQLAGRVKEKEPILVIMGNPPYSGISSNTNEWTEELLKTDIDGAQSYYKVDGKPLGERKLWLQDDYVKFLRFAQWKIHKAGRGIVAMITNHGYLDNPTFRGMRQSLMKTFDEIYVLDLHGNSLKKETAPDGSKDENVFDIRQGVAIVILVKRASHKSEEIFHFNKYGTRKEKNIWLTKNDFASTDYLRISPSSPWYFLFPRNIQDIRRYLKWESITKIFPQYNVGLVTARDKFVTDFDIHELKRRIFQFRDLDINDEIIIDTFNIHNTSTFDIHNSRKKLSEEECWDQKFRLINYRPFDIRHIFYSKWVIERPAESYMRHMLKENIGLTFTRPSKPNYQFSVFVSTNLIDQCLVGNKSAGAGISYIAPLYWYPDQKNPDLFSQNSGDRIPNISSEITNKLNNELNEKLMSEEILNYIYSIFYSNLYRETYAEFLSVDFPRVPFTKDYQLFKELSSLGEKLIKLHLLKSSELDKPKIKFQGQGEDTVIGRRRFDEATGRVYINKDYYFEGVEPEVWEYQIGGYQVMHKYLNDRKGRKMDDPRHYIHFATAIAKTIEIQEEIDALYPEVEKDVIAF